MQRAGSEVAATLEHDISFAFTSSADEIAVYLSMKDLMELSSTANFFAACSKELRVWNTVANYEHLRFSFAAQDTDTLKELVRAVREIEVFDVEFNVTGPEQGKRLVQAARRAQAMTSHHFRGPGKIASTFALTFTFERDDVEEWASGQAQELASHSLMFVPNNDSFEDALSLRMVLCDSGSRLVVENLIRGEPLTQPLLIHICALSQKVILRQLFFVTRVGSENIGRGPCILSASRQAAADALAEGLACIMHVRDVDVDASQRFCLNLNALNLQASGRCRN